MSRAPVKPVKSSMVGPDLAVPTAAMELSGIVRTTKGYAVARVTLRPDGSYDFQLGRSQPVKHFVALEHKRILGVEAQKA